MGISGRGTGKKAEERVTIAQLIFRKLQGSGSKVGVEGKMKRTRHYCNDHI